MHSVSIQRILLGLFAWSISAELENKNICLALVDCYTSVYDLMTLHVPISTLSMHSWTACGITIGVTDQKVAFMVLVYCFGVKICHFIAVIFNIMLHAKTLRNRALFYGQQQRQKQLLYNNQLSDDWSNVYVWTMVCSCTGIFNVIVL